VQAALSAIVVKTDRKRSYGASGEDPAPSSLEPTDGGAPCRSRMT
jgi:hypothetical protein